MNLRAFALLFMASCAVTRPDAADAQAPVVSADAAGTSVDGQHRVDAESPSIDIDGAPLASPIDASAAPDALPTGCDIAPCGYIGERCCACPPKPPCWDGPTSCVDGRCKN